MGNARPSLHGTLKSAVMVPVLMRRWAVSSKPTQKNLELRLKSGNSHRTKNPITRRLMGAAFFIPPIPSSPNLVKSMLITFFAHILQKSAFQSHSPSSLLKPHQQAKNHPNSLTAHSQPVTISAGRQKLFRPVVSKSNLEGGD